MKRAMSVTASVLLALLFNLQMGCVSSEWFSLSGSTSARGDGKNDPVGEGGRNTRKEGVYVEQVDHHGQMVDYSDDPAGCIICHDGTVASSAHYCTVECGFGTSHSILKEYPPRFKEESYAPLESLQEKGIRLFNGKVGCVSCHDLKKTTQYHLVIDNIGSALCFGCHIT